MYGAELEACLDRGTKENASVVEGYILGCKFLLMTN
jgi:hypothetical protein